MARGFFLEVHGLSTVAPSPNMWERMRGILDFGATPVEVAVGRATAERREPLDTAEENAGEAKLGWLRMERRAVKVVVSGTENDSFEEFGLGGICRTEGGRLETGEANGSVSDAADVAVFGRVSVPEEWPWVRRLSFSLLLLLSDMMQMSVGS